RTFLCMCVEWVLRAEQRYCARRTCSSQQAANVIQRFAPGVSSLQSRTAVSDLPCQRSLQRVIGRVRRIGNHGLEPEASSCDAATVEVRKLRESRTRSLIRVWVGNPGKAKRRCSRS